MPYKYRTKVLSYLTDKGYSQYRNKCHPDKVYRI